MSKGKNKRTQYHRTNTVIVIFCEGDTEAEFYPKLVSHIRKKHGGILNCRIECKNLKGIGNYNGKLINYFKNRICIENKGYIIKVALCYDSDVFEGYQIKPVDWQIIEEKLRRAGASEIIHVIARRSIEDWFLLDTEGLRKFLGRSTAFKKSGYRGLKGLTELLQKGNKTYKKGKKCEGLIDHLDLDAIIRNVGADIEPFTNWISN